jgi:hypothetical protein
VGLDSGMSVVAGATEHAQIQIIVTFWQTSKTEYEDTDNIQLNMFCIKKIKKIL